MAIRVFVNGLQSWLDGLTVALADQLRAMEIEPSRLPLWTSDPEEIPARCIALYFANGPHATPEADLRSLERLIAAGVTVLPVVDSVVGAERKLPELLHPFNALAIDPEKAFSTLVDEVLSRIWLARRTHKLFLSYKRSDSQAIARELWRELAFRGYEVFLDEVSIARGEDFQRELKWWLNDADFLLLLASPRLGESKWVLQEIEAANLASVGIFALTWPGVTGETLSPLSALTDDQKIQLGEGDFAGLHAPPSCQRLRRTKRVEIIRQITTYRAQAVQRRMRRQLALLKDSLEERNLTVDEKGHRLGDLKVLPEGRDPYFVRTLPFRPTLDTVNDLRHEFGGQPGPKQVVLYYRENYPRDPRVEALRWMLGPKREGETPERFQLMPDEGNPLDLETLL
jgi:TIR domain